MREKYESLSLATLKELAKARGLKGISTLRKPALIERMLQEDEKEQQRYRRSSETVQKEEIRESKREDRQEEHQAPVRQYRQNGHIQENRAFYDNRRRNNWQEGGTRAYNNQNENRRYGNSQGEFTRAHGSQNDGRRYGNAQGENFRTYGSQNEGRRYGNGQDENVRTYNNQSEDRRTGYSQDENSRTCNNQNQDCRTATARRKIQGYSTVRMRAGRRIYSRTMQKFRQRQLSWTAGRKQTEFLRFFRTDMDLSAVRIFFREK